MNKGEGKRKGTTKRKAKTTSTKKRSEPLSSSVSKEIVGLAMIGIGLLVMIGIFSTKSGLFGQLLRSIFVGGFGIGGYIIPIGAMILGIFYMQGRFDKLFRLLVYGGEFTLMLMVFFHLLSYGEDTTISLGSLTYGTQASWQNGGYIGALVGYALLKLIGIYGTYILLGVSYGIWMLLVTQFPIFSWLHEKLDDGVGQLKAHRLEAQRLKRIADETSSRRQRVEASYEEETSTTFIPVEQEERISQKPVGASESISYLEEEEVNIPFFDGTNYQEERTMPEISRENEYDITHTEHSSSKNVWIP